MPSGELRSAQERCLVHVDEGRMSVVKVASEFVLTPTRDQLSDVSQLAASAKYDDVAASAFAEERPLWRRLCGAAKKATSILKTDRD